MSHFDQAIGILTLAAVVALATVFGSPEMSRDIIAWEWFEPLLGALAGSIWGVVAAYAFFSSVEYIFAKGDE
jgi:hypothetical protein